ncbi:glycosyltransferase [uncultured Clostridium sp.]|uniref:glycosyltransferase n=1 Tax=uncultured Clostridium sp. TaxID=59620 RepID=UPI0028E1A42D|nr:glycosyltransferase [uncultured Clostridium sp.]
MKKIVHVVEAFGGGIYSFLTELCNELSKEYEVVVVYSERKETPKYFKKDFNDNIKFIKVDMCRGLNPYKNIKSLFQLKSILKKEKPDLIHLHSSKAGFLGRIVSYWNGFNMNKVFYNPHGFSFLQQNENKFKRNIYLNLEQLASKFGGCIVGCSKGEYKEALKISKRCVNINNAIDTEKIDQMLVDNNLNRDVYKSNIKITIGTVGRMCYQKNPLLFNEVAKKFPQCNFIWIGDGELKGELTSENIKITGWMDRKEVIREVLNFDIFIMTSLWEGLPIALLEAMYLKKPIVANNVIGNNNVVFNDYNGFLCNNLNDFVNSIDKLINDTNLINEISSNSKKYILENHLLKDMICNYKNLYLGEF